MSTICLAAQRSFQTGEAVWFSYRLPSLNKILIGALTCLCCLGAILFAGMYAHIYWHLRHPAPVPKPVSVAQPETQLSDMHYVYVSKPFPAPKPKTLAPEYNAPPLPTEDPTIMERGSDWQQAPESDISSEPLPDSHEVPPATESVSLKERFMQALKDQQQDYSQGKRPEEPVDESQASTVTGDEVINQTTMLRTERISATGQKKSPPAFTHGDIKYDSQ
ncbi:hypothetical protein [Leclercia sp.]|uniref:hypothetical protein n=1 Tax=Leclercia sp. TaxID=1898428 RepID=UPI002FDC9333